MSGEIFPPRWIVKEEDDDCCFDPSPVYAWTAESAAKVWARRTDAEGGYTIVGGAAVVVTVRLEGSDESVRLVVTGEAVPEYRAVPAPPEAGL
jgi:hypothetical protein